MLFCILGSPPAIHHDSRGITPAYAETQVDFYQILGRKLVFKSVKRT
ncbi:hypothetical protein PHYC_03646 [Phycisphaerales bacterium]|nr:hypothetical protein PHYC_03646 [Phycisphaerales bacterium]